MFKNGGKGDMGEGEGHVNLFPQQPPPLHCSTTVTVNFRNLMACLSHQPSWRPLSFVGTGSPSGCTENQALLIGN